MTEGGGRGHPSSGWALVTSEGVLQLAFPGHPFERLVRILDSILIIGSVGGKQPYNLIGTIGSHMADRTGGEVNGLADLKLVLLQRGSPELQLHGSAPFDGASPRSRRHTAARTPIASKIPLLKRPPSATGSGPMCSYLST